MTKAILTRALGALAILVLALPARADEPKAPQPFVVLVGISNYEDKQIKARPHAEDDVKALYDLFTDKGHLGVDDKHVRLLLGSEDKARKSQPATRANILDALKWIAKEAGPNDLVIFTFIGEGGPLGKSGDRRCYFTADSTVKGREKDALAASDVGEVLKGLKSQRFCTFLDVDFKGFTGDDAVVAEPTLGKAPYSEFLGEDDSDDHAPLPGRVVFLATNGLSTSLDLEKHGVFTEVLLKGLKGAADKDGYEPDSLITVDELTEYMDKELPALTKEHGKTKEEKGQLHFVLGGRGNHYALTNNPDAAAKVKERLDKLAQMAKAKKISEKFAEEGKALLSRMPRLEAQRSLRKEYQKLVDGGDLAKFEEQRDAILESTKLKRSDAITYGAKVVDAAKKVRTAYVKEINKGDMIAWGIKGLYRRLDEKIPEEIETKLKDVKNLEEADLVALLADARVHLGKREDLDNHKDIDITLQRMLRNLDPYTTYIDPQTLADWEKDMGEFTGIGIQIRKDIASDMLLVATPIKGSPAYKAGIWAGDIITKIYRDTDSLTKPNEKIPEKERELSTKGLPLSEAVKKIVGAEGTKVKLTVLRDGTEKEFELTRSKITVESVHGVKRKANDEWDYFIDEDQKIAYVRLSSFSRDTFKDLNKVMDDLTKRGVKGFVLDLRFNPGGLLTSAVNISELYIQDGLVVTIRPRVGRPDAIPVRKNVTHLTDFPMVCLVNGYSASGSEIVSAALQDHSRALIIGERSYGKGSVQNIVDWDGGKLKMTTATFWRPSDKNLNKASTKGTDEEDWGVIPDKVVSLTAKEREELVDAQHESEVIRRKDKPAPESKFKDKQLEEAIEYLRGQIKLSRAPGK
jgi:C-terminal peptidase prc